MSLDAAPLWTGEQHAWLQALGHTVWVPGRVPEPEVATAKVQMPEARSARTSGPRDAPAPVARRPVPTAPSTQQEDAPRRAAAPMRRSGARLHDTLRFELIRASGLNPNAAESAAIIASWPDSATLRGNPAAKRALWPMLRALRKAAR